MKATAIPAAHRPAIRDVLEEHLEEMAFLWIQRRKLLFSTDVPLRRLPGHDERIDAHCDGLVVGGRESVEVALKRLDEEEDPWVCAAELRTWLVIGAPDPATALARFEAMPPELAPSWREALRWCDAATIERLFPPARATALPPAAFALAVEALAWHQLLPAPAAAHAARHADAAVRASLARTLGWAGMSEPAAEALGVLVDDAEPNVRRRARLSAGLRDAVSLCDKLRRARPGALEAFDLQLLGLFGDDQDVKFLARAAESEPLLDAGLRALGDLGTDDAIETLLRVLAVPLEAAQLAATLGLERALGPLAGEPGDDPKPAPPADVREQWETLRRSLPRGARACYGKPRPWSGEQRDEPLFWRWRSGLVRPSAETRPLTRHVPDGFWDAAPSIVAEPGV